jgi:hypothetical protein
MARFDHAAFSATSNFDRRILMKLRLPHFALPLLPLLLTLTTSVASADDNHRDPCSNKTIKGQYGFSYSGQVLPGAGPPFTVGPIAGVAMFTFDGRGQLSLVDSTLYNGVSFPVVPFSNPNFGTYSVNADCTGVFEITSLGLTASMVIMEGGRTIHDVVTNPNTAITAVGVKR